MTVTPPAIGSTTFGLRVWEKGIPITGDTGAAILHLYPAAQASLRANLTLEARGARFMVQGSLASTGTWRADVLIRTVTVNEYRTLRFAFTIGPSAAFVRAP